MTAGALDIVTLAEARAFLNIADSDTSEDVELQVFITGMTDIIEAEVGPVVARSETAGIDGSVGLSEIPAPKWPMVSITSGTYLSDSSAVDVTKMVGRKGLIVTIDASPLPLQPWTLTYQAGRSAIPSSVKQGALEVLKLAWATQRGKEAPAFLISYRAAAWFRPKALALGFA